MGHGECGINHIEQLSVFKEGMSYRHIKNILYRLVAAIVEDMSAVPCIFLEHLTEAQRLAI